MNYEPLPAINTFPQFSRSIGMLSPLDLSLRSAIVPITPPTTPSPPRKRFRSTEDENNGNIWRPHTFGYFENLSILPWNSISNTSGQSQLEKPDEKNKVCSHAQNPGNRYEYPIEETIVLTEDEGNNDSNDDADDDNDYDNDNDDDDDDDEFVDVISNDDDINLPITLQGNQIQENKEKQIPNHNSDENKTDVLTRDKLIYEDIELHNKAIKGFEKLFEKTVCYEKSSDTNLKKSNDENLKHTLSASQSIFKQIIRNKCEKRRLKVRKQLIDEDNSSPVSGTIIRKLRDDEELVVRKGDIDPAFNVVEITDEAKTIIASIDNKIGSYICQLCRTLYDDAFQLAQHRCTRIVHIEYRCSECDKVFNCPANLASHKRWHKPKPEAMSVQNKKQNMTDSTGKTLQSQNVSVDEDDNVEGSFGCHECGKTFRRQAYLKKHLTSHQTITELKPAENYKHSTSGIPSNVSGYHFHPSSKIYQHSHILTPHLPSTGLYSAGSIRFPSLFHNIDHRRLHPFNEFYFHNSATGGNQRLSAFQYVNASPSSSTSSHGIPHNLNISRLDGITPTFTPTHQLLVK